MDLNHSIHSAPLGEESIHEPTETHGAADIQTHSEPPKRGKKGKFQGQTGPRSKRGKEISRQNCKMTHGLRAKKLLLPFEDPVQYEAHMAQVLRTLEPQDPIEVDIANTYGYVTWTSPRAESYRQSFVRRHMEYIEPKDVAKRLGLSKEQCAQAPNYLMDMNHEISVDKIERAIFLLGQYDSLSKDIAVNHLEDIDWNKAVDLYPELFDALSSWVASEAYIVPLYQEKSRHIHLDWTSDPSGIVEILAKFSYVLDYERIFMDRKPEIRVHIEDLFWRTSQQTMQGIGCDDHFVKIQNFAFVQLERLAAYRKIKRSLATTAAKESDQA